MPAVRVKSAVLTVGRSLPVYPDDRTCSVSAATSQKCRQRTCTLAWEFLASSFSSAVLGAWSTSTFAWRGDKHQCLFLKTYPFVAKEILLAKLGVGSALRPVPIIFRATRDILNRPRCAVRTSTRTCGR